MGEKGCPFNLGLVCPPLYIFLDYISHFSQSGASFHVIISPRGPVHWLREALVRQGCNQMFYLP